MRKHIPTKTCKPNDNLPYIISEITKLIKKQDSAFKTRKKAQKNFLHSTSNCQILDHKVKELKRQIQKKTRAVYWIYIEAFISPMADSDNI